MIYIALCTSKILQCQKRKQIVSYDATETILQININLIPYEVRKQFCNYMSDIQPNQQQHATLPPLELYDARVANIRTLRTTEKDVFMIVYIAGLYNRNNQRCR